MSMSNREKQKRKRAELKKSLSRWKQGQKEQQKLGEYAVFAKSAYVHGDYRSALDSSMRVLKSDPKDFYLRNIAISCAKHLREELTLFRLLEENWKEGQISDKRDCYLLGELAIRRKDFGLARTVFTALRERSSRFWGRPPKGFMKDVDTCLKYVDAMERGEATRGDSTLRSFPERQKWTKADQGHVTEVVPARPQPQLPPAATEIPELTIEFETTADAVTEVMRDSRQAGTISFDLALQAYKHSFRISYDQLICLPTLRNVESLWHQEETARKVMKTFRGRAILADEVGLGKTIEAGLVLKEYLLRGLISSVLILTPSSLVNQWQEELREKFDLAFISSHEPLFRQNPDRFWSEPLIVASLSAARSKRHFHAVTSRSYDLVIVDEAHHLKNQTTKSWKLVNELQKAFILLLTATPVQNNLEELYNLVTILKPGHLKTRKSFKEQFVARGNPTDPRNRETLRQLLKEVMIRNTRSVTHLKLPPRFAYTTCVSPTSIEAEFYRCVSDMVADGCQEKTGGLASVSFRTLLEAAGSSHHAAVRRLVKMGDHGDDGMDERVSQLVRVGNGIGISSKTRKVLDLLKSSSEKKIVFVNYLATLEHLHEVLSDHGIAHAVFQGSLSAGQKKAAIEEFRGGCPILLTTGTGGEGHNLQFCRIMINYDLPWNPMAIEQRIGRIHRIGQEREVHVYNFCAAGSVEDHILHVLDRKINMFELVIGEVDMILGRLQDEKDFADMVFEIWSRHSDEAERKDAFDSFGTRLKLAKAAYEKTKALDEKLFQEDFGA